MSLRYIRTTHNSNGEPKKFSAEANHYWHTTNAGFVGHMLDPIIPITINEIYDKIVQYEQQEGGQPLFINEIQEALDILIRYNMVAKKDKD